MRIVGLDLSITATGIALVDGSTLTVKTNPKDGDRRLREIVDAVNKAIIHADVAVIEEAPPGLRGNAIKALHMVQGAVRAELLALCVPYAVVNPGCLKAYATGRKGADKASMALAAMKRTGTDFTEPPRDNDQCDAAWLRWMGLDRCGEAEFFLPQDQRAQLEKVDWGSWR